jgi:uncharacterized integral membrane protein
MKLLKNIFTALIFLLAITFSLKNNENVSLYYYFQIGPVDLPLYLLVFISVFFGMLIGGVDSLVQRTKSSLAIRRLRKELENKEGELTSLRNLPITEPDVTGEES